MIKNTLTEPELRRFKLQMNMPGIGMEGQEKLKNARIAVIGLGGTGTNVLQYLSSVGVGYLAIIDNSLVDELSIQRQTLYGSSDWGKLKTIISRQRLKELFPHTEYEIINLRLDTTNIDRILQPFDLVVDASNNCDTNYLINDACLRMNIPWIFTAVSGTNIMVSVFNHNNGPSLRCYNQTIEYDNAVVVSLSYGFAGLFGAIECVKVIVGQFDTMSYRMFKFNIIDYSSNWVEITKDKHNFRFVAQ